LAPKGGLNFGPSHWSSS
jgi:hypothetical protein